MEMREEVQEYESSSAPAVAAKKAFGQLELDRQEEARIKLQGRVRR